MPDLLKASPTEKLWHKMRHDLMRFVPETDGNRLLMCPACGRFLPQDWFDLEHLIPRQILKHDPQIVRIDPATPANVRAGNLLLCKKPLKIRGNAVYGSGCNSWKGSVYDKRISELISGKGFQANKATQVHIIAALGLAYLAMVAEFGYVVTLMRSGLLLREQFFNPYKFHPELPLRSQILLGGGQIAPDAPAWSKPFSFGFQRSGACIVGARNFALIVPISRDPREPVAVHLKIVPTKYKLRPNFGTVFD